MDEDNVEELVRESVKEQLSLGNAVAEMVKGGYHLEPINEGYLNHVFKVISSTDQSKSCVVKVYLSYPKALGKGICLEPHRSNKESDTIGYFNTLVTNCCPSILAHDETRHIVFFEDLRDFSTWKSCLLQSCDLKVGAKLADILVAIHSSSHRIKLGDKFQDLANRFCPLPLLSKFLNDCHFNKPFSLEKQMAMSTPGGNSGIDLDGSVVDRLNELKDDSALQKALTLANEWMGDASEGCCIHGDLHADSVMCKGEDVRLIDVECSRIGPPAYDVALLVCNYVLLYHYHQHKARKGQGGQTEDDHTDGDKNKDGQHHEHIKRQMLDLICITLSRYMEGMGRILGDSFDHHFVWKQVLLFLGLEIIAWISGPPSFPELNSFPKAQLNCLNTAMRILHKQSLSLDTQSLSELIHN